MIVVYAEKEDMGIKFASALGGINYKGTLVDIDSLSGYQTEIKKEIADKQGYIKTFYNGKDYIITWGWGHFGTLKDIKDYNPEYKYWNQIPLPFFPQKFETKLIKAKDEYFQRRNERQFKIVKNLFNDPSCEYIINATDWEREGELIFAYVYDLTKTKTPYYRLRSNSKTKKQIQKDFDKLVSENENVPYVMAARARSIADWIIGINMTIAATIYLSKDRKMINVGRVLTPTLNIIVDREKEINNFVSKTSYGILANFKTPEGDEYRGKVEDISFDKEEDAHAFIKNLERRGIVSKVERTTKNENPPLLHNTQSLQIEANEMYGYTLEKTLSLAQKLYEGGYTTYPRVDAQYLTEDKKTETTSLIRLLGSIPAYNKIVTGTSCLVPKRYFNDSKVEGHDAIITTEVIPKGSDLDADERRIYDLIARRFIASTYGPAVKEKIQVVTEVTDASTGEVLEFKTNGTFTKDKGWEETLLKTKETHDLPKSITKGKSVTPAFESNEIVTKPPKRFTDATLIKAMENCGRKMEEAEAKEILKKSKGIGRPATRAAILERLILANYITRKSKLLYPTEHGMDVIDSIVIDDIKSPILTAKWEKQLDEIEESTPTESIKYLKAYLDNIKETTGIWCKELEKNRVKGTYSGAETNFVCPTCGEKLKESKFSYMCKCGFKINKEIANKKLSEKNINDLLEKGSTPSIKGFKNKNGKPFSAKLVLSKAYKCEECGKIQSNDKGENKCYNCGGNLVDTGNKVIGFTFPKR